MIVVQNIQMLVFSRDIFVGFVNASQFPHKDVEIGDLQKSIIDVGIRDGDSLLIVKQDKQQDQDTFGNNKPIKDYVETKNQEYVVRRQIPSDNSCLFNAVGYIMNKKNNQSKQLRSIIATTVTNNKEFYSEGFLGKSNEAYSEWILKPNSWGGAIELSILSDFFKRKIAAFDIRTKRCDMYGEDKDYSEVGMLIYDGLHYDSLALAPDPNSPLDFDVTIFKCSSAQMNQVMVAAQQLVESYFSAQQFTNTNNFQLQCAQCLQGFVGEKEATAHAQETGHINFQEYR
eukprot:TRINITY_DN27973_c0_g1_i3.p1 TRINITY_DN27973_c0_g1~~TRINITY_DN27973_c0_g1_i3.p1  ORF type:complete len:286 (-),score=22.98 TRINITY_DN27973_c0_g1_i3:453-1310(-)